MKKKYAIIDGKRYKLPEGLGISEREYGVGVELEEVFILPKLKHVITQTFSIWDRGDGACQGRGWRLHDPNTEEGQWVIARLARHFNSKSLTDLLPIVEG